MQESVDISLVCSILWKICLNCPCFVVISTSLSLKHKILQVIIVVLIHVSPLKKNLNIKVEIFKPGQRVISKGCWFQRSVIDSQKNFSKDKSKKMNQIPKYHPSNLSPYIYPPTTKKNGTMCLKSQLYQKKSAFELIKIWVHFVFFCFFSLNNQDLLFKRGHELTITFFAVLFFFFFF